MKGRMRIKKQRARQAQGWSRNYLLCYTLLFVFLSALVFLPFCLAGKGFVWAGADWSGDGESQYFPYLYYMGNWLREGIAGLLSGGGWTQYDFSIGMGADVRTVVRFHPLDVLSVLVPGGWTEGLYGFLILLRFYLAGLSFSAFCFYWKKPQRAVLTGSMIYIFCGYALKLGVEHPFFMIAMIILPLLLLGAERVLRREGVLFFAFVTALGFISHYYFMYMCSFAMAGYVLLRCADLYREQRIRRFFAALGRLFAGYFLGIGMAAVFLFPTVCSLLDSARIEGGKTRFSLWVYENKSRYLNWFFDLISPYRGTGNNTNLNYAVLALPALVLLFVRKFREKWALKAAFLVEIAVLLIPAGGYILGGFSNINNRWVFILSLTVSVICVAVFEDFGQWGRRRTLAFAGILCAFAAVCGYRFLTGKQDIYQLAALAELALCGLVFLALQKRKTSARGWSPALLTVVCVSTVVNGWMTYGETFGNLTEEFQQKGQALDYYEESALEELAALPENGFYRADTDHIWIGEENSPLMLDYRGISLYNSIVNAGELEYLMETENPGLNSLLRVFSLDGRTVPEALANVRYYWSDQGEESVPYGFAPVEGSGNLYENQYALAFGYTYDTVISRENYEKLSSLEKQQVMLEAALVEELPEAADAEQDGPEAGTMKTAEGCKEEIETVSVRLPQSGENVERTESGYRVGKGGGSISFELERRAGTEAYLRLEGLEWEQAYSTVTIAAGTVEKRLSLRADGENYALGRKDYLVCLGSGDESGTVTVTIRFPKKGTYGLEGLEVWYAPVDQYVSRIGERNEEALTEVVFEKNRITGQASLTGRKVMVFSVLYDRGWSAWVDGKKADLQKVNAMYLGLVLEPGTHTIELRYETPGLRAGAWISLASVLLFLTLWIRGRKKEERGTQ